MNIFPKLTMLALCVALTQFLACKKAPAVDPPGETTCRINKVYLEGPAAIYYGRDTATLYYNAAGNPDSLIMSNPYIGNSNTYLRYDQYNRISDVIPYFSIQFDASGKLTYVHFESWVHFLYDDNNPNSMPTRDSVYNMGIWNNGNYLTPERSFIGYYTYDTQGRIIKYEIPSSPSLQLYNYDTNGNLIRPGLTYDSKKNFRAGSKVLMLVDRNFSVNNHVAALSYNTAGYPTVFPEPTAGLTRVTSFLQRNAQIINVDYTCTESPVLKY